MNKQFTNLLSFIKFTHQFQRIIRCVYVTGLDRDENDMEHSYQLALTAWYLNNSNKFGLDSEKLIQYALVHDLVETYAGDTFFHSKDKSLHDSKSKREADALVRIKNEFSEFSEMIEFIEKYEARIDLESKFIYALDKVLPVINIYLDGGRSWKRDHVSLEVLRTKDKKVNISPEIEKLWYELVDRLEKEQNKLFES